MQPGICQKSLVLSLAFLDCWGFYSSHKPELSLKSRVSHWSRGEKGKILTPRAGTHVRPPAGALLAKAASPSWPWKGTFGSSQSHVSTSCPQCPIPCTSPKFRGGKSQSEPASPCAPPARGVVKASYLTNTTPKNLQPCRTS